MSLEVEIKAKWKADEKKLSELEATFTKEVVQEDIYFQHPCRDFKETDEAFRIRKQDDEYLLTYKGPKLDDSTKTREEIEFIIHQDIEQMILALGFERSGYVKKKRRFYNLNDIEVCVDEIEGLGEYIELESKNENDIERMFQIFSQLGIKKEDTIRESYLELLNNKK